MTDSDWISSIQHSSPQKFATLEACFDSFHFKLEPKIPTVMRSFRV